MQGQPDSKLDLLIGELVAVVGTAPTDGDYVANRLAAAFGDDRR